MSVNDDPEWRALAQDWTVPPRADAGTDLPSVAEVRRRARLQTAIFVAELAVCAAAAGALAWRAAHGAAWLPTLTGAAFTAFALLAAIWAWRTRDAGSADSVRDALRLSIGQARTWLRWIVAGYAICAAALVHLAVMQADASPPAPPIAAAAAAFVLATLVALAIAQRRQRRRLSSLRVLQADLDDTGDTER
ncbi:MAG: hypothetical protein DI564_03415 [Rhodanobacter denitrificans]|uniref:Transmembrane protein n=1 Tax=Rhodanobacter denitrificans TaxID=666685 RepID=A0A2W5KSD0_9GAMM|nr:MAG: hypothetical protein DI564_03415 [Rhodanobacter denitrificans]